MKKIVSVAFSVLMLCSLLLLGIASAGNPAYSMTAYTGAAFIVHDGIWSQPDEWLDVQPVNMSNNARFTVKLRSFEGLSTDFMIEAFGDNTDDAGDLWQICIDSDNSGGAAPDTDDYKIEIQGHTTLKTYKGNGTGWVEFTPDVDTDFGLNSWADSRTATPWNTAPHWMFELREEDREQGQIKIGDAPNGLRVAAYDASTNTTSSWAPDSDPDVPSTWGVIANYDPNPYIPEGFSIVFLVLLSSVAVVVSFHFMRKKQKTARYSSAKTAINTL
jgi:hypothetical protein